MAISRSSLPLDRATHRWHLLRGSAARFRYLLHRLEEVATGVRDRCRARGVKPSTILQLVLCVETKEIGRALSAVRARYLLRLVDYVGEGESMLGRKRLHVVEGVLAVHRGIIRHDG